MTIPSPENRVLAPNFWRPELGELIEAPTPTEQELVALWQEYIGSDDDALPLQSVYGAYRLPQQPVKAVASIDLCEVLRQTGAAYHRITGIVPNGHTNYTTGEWPKHESYPDEWEKSLMHTVLGIAMNRGLVEPVAGFESIGRIIMGWQANGVYIAANTSTLRGSETGTIRNTLGRDYQGCFDAIIFPRNHDGAGSITKATALSALAAEAGLPLDSVPVIHIDDTAHHVDSFHVWGKTDPSFRVDLKTFTPVYGDNDGIEETSYVDTPLEAFIQADQHLKDKGVIS